MRKYKDEVQQKTYDAFMKVDVSLLHPAIGDDVAAFMAGYLGIPREYNPFPRYISTKKCQAAYYAGKDRKQQALKEEADLRPGPCKLSVKELESVYLNDT